jgi:hypothetical protein
LVGVLYSQHGGDENSPSCIFSENMVTTNESTN